MKSNDVEHDLSTTKPKYSVRMLAWVGKMVTENVVDETRRSSGLPSLAIGDDLCTGQWVGSATPIVLPGYPEL